MGTKAEKDRQKQIQDRCQNLLTQMLRDDDNKYCVDCDAKGPRWASWNLGIFLCIRCAGIHRNLGVHISKVKSVNLDSWTPEQVVSLQQMGNSRARAVYEANLPDSFRRPQTDMALEAFIRAKYDAKKYIAKEWVPPQLPKVNWDKELDEEEKARKKKREAKAGTTPIASLAPRKLDSVIPAPLPKPATSPKTQRAKGGAQASAALAPAPTSGSADLLGLDTPVSESGPKSGGVGGGNLSEDVFSSFLAAAPAPSGPASTTRSEEEERFFNQPLTTPGGAAAPGGDKKLTTDSILALYAQGPTQSAPGFGAAQAPGMPTGVGVAPFMAQPGVGMFQGYQMPNGTATAQGGINPHGMHGGVFPPPAALGGLGSNPFFAAGGPLSQPQAKNRMPGQGGLPPSTGLTNNLWH